MMELDYTEGNYTSPLIRDGTFCLGGVESWTGASLPARQSVPFFFLREGNLFLVRETETNGWSIEVRC
jgi:hypothetical protein